MSLRRASSVDPRGVNIREMMAPVHECSPGGGQNNIRDVAAMKPTSSGLN